MMLTCWKRITAFVMVILILTIVPTGCWDSREIDSMLILTGIGMDVSDDPDQISISAQFAGIKKKGPSSEKATKENLSSAILINTVGESLSRGLNEMERNSNQKVMFQHNQIRLFGLALAEKGIKEHLDLVMRDHEARLEVPLLIVDGLAKEALYAKFPQEPISGVFIKGMLDDLAETSQKYRVKLIDFIQRTLDGNVTPVIPIIKVIGEDENQEIRMTGMAIFDDGKMIGRLSNDEAIGYILSFGEVKKYDLEIEDGQNRAILHIPTLDCKRKVTLRKDGGVRVDLSINSIMRIGELSGFKGMKISELVTYLENLSREEIKNKITGCFETAKNLNADIFGYCTEVYQKHPKQWEDMKNHWDEVFSDIELNIQVKTKITETGQISQSLEMEEKVK